MPTTIVTDSTCDLSQDLVEQKGIVVVPLKVLFGSQTFIDQVDLTTEELYRKMKSNTETFATTSQPTPQEFIDRYSHIEGDIVSIHIASSLSGTYNSALKAKAMMGEDGERIHVFDSDQLTFGTGLQVLAAQEYAHSGLSPEEIIAKLKIMRGEVKIMFSLQDLEYVAKGGRIGKAEAYIGNLLKLRPIVSFRNHALTVVSRAFGNDQAISTMVKQAQKDNEFAPIKRMFVAHGNAPKERDILEQHIRDANLGEAIEIIYGEVGSVIASHAGPGGAIGIMYHS